MSETSLDPRPEPGEAAAETPWLPSPVQIHTLASPEALADAAAKRFVESARRAIDSTGRFLVVLAGGRTPRPLYERLAGEPYRERVPWPHVCFVFGDERCVPPEDEASHYRMVREALFDPLEIPQHRVLRMKGEQDPAEAARRYEVRLGDLFLNEPKRHFDLVLLGVGEDGRTASLFPGSEALEEPQRWVVATRVPATGESRLTLTLPALNSARRVLWLATGEEKARAVAEAFGGVEHAVPHPCERVAPLHARRELLLDRPAASKIPAPDATAGER